MAPMGCLPGDLNEDGRMDILVYYWGRPPIAFLRKDDGDRGLTRGSFAAHSEVALELIGPRQCWFTSASPPWPTSTTAATST